MRKIVLLSLAAAMAAAPAPAQDTALAARIQRVENGLTTPVTVVGRPALRWSITERMRVHNTPAVSIAVINNGHIEWARAYGTLQTGGSVPADTATLFQAASISKPVSVLGALLLVEQGVLALDTDVNRYLRSWRVPENAFTAREKVTLRRIASHNAGLTVSGFPGYAAGEPVPTTVQVLDGVPPANTAPVRVDTIPGSLGRYSGGGLTVMQQMLVDVAGRPFPMFMRETVLQPLGMIHSSYEQDVPPERAARTARAHDDRGVPIPGGWHRYPEMAAAGLWTTASDLARFVLAVYHANEGAEGGVISPALARQMLTLQQGENGGGAGLGLSLERMGTPAWYFGHSGNNEGYRADVMLFGETGRGAVILTNSAAGNEVMSELQAALATEYGWPILQPVQKTAGPMPAAALRELPGRYQIFLGNDTITITISAEGGALKGAGPNWPVPRVFHPLAGAGLRFFLTESEREYVFERGEDGRIARMRITGGGGAELVAERVRD
jgi:CubicO group peptidase (beta-lactamase class C family)